MVKVTGLSSIFLLLVRSVMLSSRVVFAFASYRATRARRHVLPSLGELAFTRSFTSLLMTAIDEDEAIDTNKTVNSVWNIPGLKKEVARLVMRSHKKIAKANTRLSSARWEVQRLTSDPQATLEELENCPNLDAIEMELKELQERLKKLNQLERSLETEKKKSAVLEGPVAALVLELGVNDEPPPQQVRVKKQKGPREMVSARLPYRRYYSLDETEIRVGKKAEDNDELSCNPEYRDGSDWWMHASGCPGSHVVIRCQDSNLSEDVIQDAAALAARQSKCNGSVIKVNLSRCRDVKKPPGAKPGLVQLTGNVKTVSVNMKEAEERLKRLDKTCQIN